MSAVSGRQAFSLCYGSQSRLLLYHSVCFPNTPTGMSLNCCHLPLPCVLFTSLLLLWHGVSVSSPLCWAEQSIRRSQRWALQSPCTQTPSLLGGKHLYFRGTWLPWGPCLVLTSWAAAPPSQYRLRCSCQPHTTAALHLSMRKGGAQRSDIPLPASYRCRQQEFSECRCHSLQFHSPTLPHFL